MIDFKSSAIEQILPPNLLSDDVKALSFAISNAVSELQTYASKIRTVSFIESLDEKILDYLAIEYSASFYEVSMSIEQKREIIKNIILWYAKGGTKQAVESGVKTVFGNSATVKEWFDINSDPYTFSIENIDISSEDSIRKYVNVIKKLKNARSILTKISQTDNFSTEKFVAITIASSIENQILINDENLILDN